MVPFDSLSTVPYSHSIITMALSCIISEIKQDMGRKSWFFSYFLVFDPSGDRHRTVAIPFSMENENGVATRGVKKFDDMFSRFGRIPACDISQVSWKALCVYIHYFLTNQLAKDCENRSAFAKVIIKHQVASFSEHSASDDSWRHFCADRVSSITVCI